MEFAALLQSLTGPQATLVASPPVAKNSRTGQGAMTSTNSAAWSSNPVSRDVKSRSGGSAGVRSLTSTDNPKANAKIVKPQAKLPALGALEPAANLASTADAAHAVHGHEKHSASVPVISGQTGDNPAGTLAAATSPLGTSQLEAAGSHVPEVPGKHPGTASKVNPQTILQGHLAEHGIHAGSASPDSRVAKQPFQPPPFTLPAQMQSGAGGSTQAVAPDQAAQPAISLHEPAAAQQLGQLLINQVKTGPQTLQVQVHPEGMGTLVISVVQHPSGVAVNVEANQMQTMQWLSHVAGQLSEAVHHAGVEISSFQVSFGQADLSNSQSSGERSGQRRERQRFASTTPVASVDASGGEAEVRWQQSHVDAPSQRISIRV